MVSPSLPILVFSAPKATSHPFLFQPHRRSGLRHCCCNRSRWSCNLLQRSTNPKNPFFQNALNFFLNNPSLPLWGSLSLSDSSNSVVDSKTVVSFLSILADYLELKYLGEKYEKLLIADIIEKKELVDDLVESDISMTVRLQIIYSKLIIRSVCSVFEESVGSRLQKFGDQIKENCFKKEKNRKEKRGSKLSLSFSSFSLPCRVTKSPP
ncbi:hypothetical protein UlMin_011030, partial [Ulmus minor]